MLTLACALLLALQDGRPEAADEAAAPLLAPGSWSAALVAGERRIPFQLRVEEARDSRLGVRLLLQNGEEELPVARTELAPGGELVLHMDPYDSRLVARVSGDGTALEGQWIRYRGPGRETRMAFTARAGRTPRFAEPLAGRPTAKTLEGRWAVTFRHGDESSPAVALLEAKGEGVAKLSGTFLTPLGDYRFLAGDSVGGRLRLSCFDGAHAFLFEAQLGEDGVLRGDFWSRDTWHESWEARRDPAARLADDFGMTTWNEGVELGALRFPDLSGELRSLDGPGLQGRPRLLVLFGSWCPNCGDATDYLRELHQRFGGRGLEVVGLAFEFGDDQERHRRVLRRYAEHKDIDYPILIAGTSDKAEASRAFPALDRVRAYPTTVFIDAEGKVRAVHTGFSGPATGAAHQRLRERFEALIGGMLQDAEAR